MKILYVGADALVCGAGYSMIKLIEELKANGCDVVPVVRQGNSEQVLTEKNISHYIVNAQSWTLSNSYSPPKRIVIGIVKYLMNIKCYFQYLKIIQKEKPDIIHINALTTYPIAQAAVKTKTPFVWHIREMLEEDFNISFWNKRFAYSLMKKATYFIAISKCVESKYQKIVGNKIRCIYNGVDRQQFYNAEHEIFKNNSIIITMAGRINENKGQRRCLIDLIPLLNNNPNIILQFAGTGEECKIQELKEICQKNHLLDSQVRFLGFVKDMGKLWSETDISIVYSKCEAFGRVTVEAKMAGALVVGYKSGGTIELIEDGKTGYLFDDHIVSLGDAVTKALTDKHKSIRMAMEGRNQVESMFTSKRNAAEVIKLYKEILM